MGKHSSTPLAKPQSQVKSSSLPLLVCTQATENRIPWKHQLPFLSAHFCWTQLESGWPPHHCSLTALSKVTRDRRAARCAVSSQPGPYPTSAASNTRDDSHSQDTHSPGFPAYSFSFSLNSFSSCPLTPGTPCAMSELPAPSIPLQDFYVSALRTFCTLRALESLAQAKAPLLRYRLTASVTATQHLLLAKQLVLSPHPFSPTCGSLGLPRLSQGNCILPADGCKTTLPSSSQVHAACRLPHGGPSGI